MAKIEYKDALTTPREQLVTVHPSQIMKDKESGEITGVYMKAQVRQDNLTPEDIAAGKGDSNPNLVTKTSKDENGKTVYNNTVRISPNQYEAIQAAAGDNVYTDPKSGAQTFAIKAPLIKVNEYKKDDKGERIPIMDEKTGQQAVTKQGKEKYEQVTVGYMPNTKQLEPSDRPIDENTLKNQYEVTNAVRQKAAADKTANMEAKNASIQANNKAAEAQQQQAVQKDTPINTALTPGLD